MKTSSFNTLIVAIIVSIFCISCEKINETVPVAECRKGDTNHPRASRYQKMIDDLLKTGVTGVSATVISPEGTWSLSGGKADLGNNVPMTPCHTLRIGSISKLFTSVTILKLQEEGVLNINDKLTKYIPERITKEIANANEVTLKQLLNHTSGIPEYLGLNTILNILNLSVAKKSAEESLHFIYGQKADFEPGKGQNYSNSNYLLLSLVIQYATGKSAYQVVTEKVIRPLRLENTFADTKLPATLVRGYYDTFDNDFMKDLTEIDNAAVGGEGMLDGGLISNSYDLATFLHTLKTGQVLTASSMAQFENFIDITQELPNDLKYIKQYGLGLMKIETDHGVGVGHSGHVHCFWGTVYHFPQQKVTVAVLTNGYSTKIRKALESKNLFNYLFEDK